MFAGVCVVMLQGDRSSDTIGAGKGFCTVGVTSVER